MSRARATSGTRRGTAVSVTEAEDLTLAAVSSSLTQTLVVVPAAVTYPVSLVAAIPSAESVTFSPDSPGDTISTEVSVNFAFVVFGPVSNLRFQLLH